MREISNKAAVQQEGLKAIETSSPPPRFEITSGNEVIESEEYIRLARQLGRESINQLRKVVSPENDPFEEMASDLKEKIIGQDEAVDEVVDALARSELRDPDRPVATYLFMGPTGVGKTELSKEFDRALHRGGRNSMVRIDCSDYAQGHSVLRLTGAPPSYVGYKEQPLFSPEKIEGKNRIILFDEIEKAAPELHQLMLQMMAEGELQLNNGRKVSFRDSIIIMTSNVGADRMQQEISGSRAGFTQTANDKPVDKEALRDIVNSAADEVFRPEFLSRIDRKILFHPHNDEQLVQVLSSYIDRSKENLLKKGITLEVTDELKREFIKTVEDRRKFGARNVVLEFSQQVLGPVSKHLMLGNIKRGSKVYAYLEDEQPGARVSVGYMTEPDKDALEAYRTALTGGGGRPATRRRAKHAAIESKESE